MGIDGGLSWGEGVSLVEKWGLVVGWARGWVVSLLEKWGLMVGYWVWAKVRES